MSEFPGIRQLGTGAAYFGCGFALSGLRLWGQMQPVAIGLAAAGTGWRSLMAAVGSAAGYRFFFGAEGISGILWVLGAVATAVLVHVTGNRRDLTLAVGMMCVTAGVHLSLPASISGDLSPGLHVLRLLLAGASALLARQVLENRDRLSRWSGAGLLLMALAQLAPWLGWALAGVAAGALPLPAAIMAGMGADLGAPGPISLMAVGCISFFLQRIFPRESWRRMAAPGMACLLLMGLQQVWHPGLLLAVGVGGIAGALVPWQYTVIPRRSRVGAAQVRLEQAARVMSQFQRQLLEYAPPAPDLPAVTEQLVKSTCGVCASRSVCAEQARMGMEILGKEEPFLCRKADTATEELHRSRDQLRRMKAVRAQQEEYRMAVVQQYGFLASALHDLSDALPERDSVPKSRFRVRVSARSRGRELADGDRVSAFPGLQCRYYVVLCDGMGTGLGASEESRGISEQIRQMLTAGLCPETALGSINSQLALTDRGGAVTVDLAELRLDAGRALLYKWGAGQTWLLRRKRGCRLGVSGPPPGLGVSVGRESTARAVLSRGETLLMLSDGICCDKLPDWAACADNMEPGALAKQILEDGGNQDDDATAVVIRLEKKEN